MCGTTRTLALLSIFKRLTSNENFKEESTTFDYITFCFHFSLLKIPQNITSANLIIGTN